MHQQCSSVIVQFCTESGQVSVVMGTGRPNREGSPHIGRQSTGVPSTAFSPKASHMRCKATGLGKVMRFFWAVVASLACPGGCVEQAYTNLS